MVVFDTNIILSAVHGDRWAIELMESYGGEAAAVTIFNKYEMLRGFDPEEEKVLLEVLERLIVYSFGDKELDQAVKLYTKVFSERRRVDEFDLLIAAIALANNETLVTNDEDFKVFGSDKILISR